MQFIDNLASLNIYKQKLKYKQNKILNQRLKDLREEGEKTAEIFAKRFFMEIKQQLLSSFMSIGLAEFYTIFTLYYGKNYNKDILRRSLTFSIDNNLNPQLTYIVKDFSTESMVKKHKKQFNKNSIEEFDRKYDGYDSLETLSELAFYGDIDNSIENDDIEDSTLSDVYDLITDNQIQGGKVMIEAKYVYQLGYNSALEKYLEYYNGYLKNSIEKKYKVKL